MKKNCILEKTVTKEDLVSKDNIKTKILEYDVPAEGGWTSWESFDVCTVSKLRFI